MSVEPLLSDPEPVVRAILDGWFDWVIIGAESGNDKGKKRPERRWPDKIAAAAKECGVPVFIKNSLAAIWGDPLTQKYPWEVQNG